MAGDDAMPDFAALAAKARMIAEAAQRRPAPGAAHAAERSTLLDADAAWGAGVAPDGTRYFFDKATGHTQWHEPPHFRVRVSAWYWASSSPADQPCPRRGASSKTPTPGARTIGTPRRARRDGNDPSRRPSRRRPSSPRDPTRATTTREMKSLPQNTRRAREPLTRRSTTVVALRSRDARDCDVLLPMLLHKAHATRERPRANAP